VSLADYIYIVDQLPSRLIEAAVDQIATLPGIGRRTALRLALSLLRRDPEKVHQLADSLKEMSDGVKPCENCHNLTEDIVCSICNSIGRDSQTICVVEDIRDLLAIENLGLYKGVYHVLGGVISPMDGVGPSDLFVQSLVDRVQNSSENTEVIFALPATMEGETTSFYLYKKLQNLNVEVTSLARGVAVGESLQYADEATLSRSIEKRTIYSVGQ